MNKRVPRKRKPVAPPVNQHVEGFPEDPAVTVLEKVLDRLSKQAIKHDDLADADAAIIQCFFASLNYDTRKDPINPIGPSKIVLSTAQRAQLKWNLRLAFNYPDDKRLVVCGDGFANRVMTLKIPALSRPELKVAFAQYALRYAADLLSTHAPQSRYPLRPPRTRGL
jgi:hypothetical protein